MQVRDILSLLVLAAFWGASFLFLRVAAPEFGPIPLIAVRVAIAALFLLPFLVSRVGFGGFRRYWKPILVVGATNSALPFCLLAFSTLYLTAGFTAIVNATSPLFGAIIAWVWLADRLNRNQVAGLLIGFLGVIVLVWDQISFRFDGASLAIPAAILASFLYGFAANFTKRYLLKANALTVATGSQISTTLVLLPMAVFLWPEEPVSFWAWMSAIILGIGGTGIAYILYFGLITRIGPTQAISVTFLVPLFAVLWGGLLIGEKLTHHMVAGCLIILVGTALVTRLIGRGRSV